MPSAVEWLGFGAFLVFVLMIVLAWRAGKRSFKSWETRVAADARASLAAELTSMAEGGRAQATSNVVVMQGDRHELHRSDDPGCEPGRVLDGVRDGVPDHDGEAAALIALCRRYGLDPERIELVAGEPPAVRVPRPLSGYGEAAS